MSTPLTPQLCHINQQPLPIVNTQMFVTDPSLDSLGKPNQLTPPNSQSRKRSFDEIEPSSIPSSDHIIKQQKNTHISSTPVYTQLPLPPQQIQSLAQPVIPAAPTNIVYQQPNPNPNVNYAWSAPRTLSSSSSSCSNDEKDIIDQEKDALSPSSLITDRKAYAGYLTRQKKECNNAEAASIWSQDVESAFMEALRCIPHVGRRKITVDGRPCGRNELISEYIFRKTGKVRTRKQVSSHIQVLKHLLKDDPEFMELVVENPTSKPSATASISPIFSKKEDKDNNNKKGVFNFSPDLVAKKFDEFEKDDSSFLPFNFSMYQIDQSPQVVRVFSQLIRPQLESPIKHRQSSKLLARFPTISQFTASNSKVPIIYGKAKFNLPIGDVNISEGSLFKSDVEFVVEISEGFEEQWTCVTKVYTLGNEVLSLVEPVVTEENLGRRSKKLVLPFANDFWAAFIVGITGKSGAKSQKEASRAVNAITMTQEIYKTKGKDTSLSLESLFSTLIWEFEMVTDSFSARTVFRKVSLEKELQQGIELKEKSPGKRSISNPVSVMNRGLPPTNPMDSYMPMNHQQQQQQQMVSYGPIPVMPMPSHIPPMMFNNSYYQEPVPIARPLTAFESYGYNNGFHPIDSNNLWYPMNNQGSEVVVKRFVDEKNELSVDAINAAERAVTLNNIIHTPTTTNSTSSMITPLANMSVIEGENPQTSVFDPSNASIKSSSPTSPLKASTPSITPTTANSNNTAAASNYTNSNNYLNLQITTPYEPLYVYDSEGNVCPIDLPLKSAPPTLQTTPSLPPAPPASLMSDMYKDDDLITSFETFHNE